MGVVVDLAGWLTGARGSGAGLAPGSGGRDVGVADVEWHPSFGRAPEDVAHDGLARDANAWDPDAVVRLERAVGRLDRLAGVALQVRGALAPDLETELFALIGQVQMGLVSEAADRAERLAARLGPARIRTR
jgi:hypothetical protein